MVGYKYGYHSGYITMYMRYAERVHSLIYKVFVMVICAPIGDLALMSVN